MRRLIKVAVFMGGKSPEHKISLMSGRQVVKSLNPKKYQVLPIIISKNGKSWYIGSKKTSGSSSLASSVLKKLDIAFIAMHGPFGEDGTIQAFLELLGVPYTGSKVLASALGMDKIYSRIMFTQSGLKTPRFFTVKKGSSLKSIPKNFNLPLFVKPNNQGSSIGATKVETFKKLNEAILKAHDYSNLALIEEFIEGIEITCGVIGNENPKALPLIEIVPKKGFFDYKAKYNQKLCDEIVPARISQSLAKKAATSAIRAYQSLGCLGFGRVDMIIKSSQVYILEVNTIPGLTPVSLLPKAAKATGISYTALIDKITRFAIP